MCGNIVLVIYGNILDFIASMQLTNQALNRSGSGIRTGSYRFGYDVCRLSVGAQTVTEIIGGSRCGRRTMNVTMLFRLSAAIQCVGGQIMFWKRFYNLCLRAGKRPNPIGKEIGLSSGIISKWKNGGIPNGETLMKLAKYFDVSVDYLLGLSPYIKINGDLVAMENSDIELKSQISENIAKLNNEGLSKVADYSRDLVDSHNYEQP